MQAYSEEGESTVEREYIMNDENYVWKVFGDELIGKLRAVDINAKWIGVIVVGENVNVQFEVSCDGGGMVLLSIGVRDNSRDEYGAPYFDAGHNLTESMLSLGDPLVFDKVVGAIVDFGEA